MLNISVLVDLSSFNYVQIISMMLWNDVWKCVEMISTVWMWAVVEI